ncbi:AFR391Wp [Eremothecium gossypii ATCC 10895]|uniref:Mitochondrial distribution and morphology protein 32 n=1 Tax=Eremothecium gossypii (strain ATCC 10895 / CBS 109.51 / FGSC 9923 / NRRL Y-1056) TaxID=284811 RepID=MDM32_EREGS|nr:AFR391Wp [Eremothecium gossypii ATCC 10895]Q753C5.1 RecName: Full=Mitochondrial distribution and morphology protein 32; Flags: Precursor [Eremothecium gossypii ATCC 10895]AAS53762.1 AFR391Wp [Eremothecium gossypii ATCC 10895]AEY98074.1 FAFR391Wp [Eremothecium gossypii FDAG1]
MLPVLRSGLRRAVWRCGHGLLQRRIAAGAGWYARACASDDAASRSPLKQEMLNSTEYLHVQNILLQKNQQRMTKQKLLSEATGFYDRFKINTKWLLIRGNRPFSGEEISTLLSWLILSQVLWVILGTTTFVSLLLFLANTVLAKEMVGKFVGNSLNRYMDGVDVQFQDAMVPEWRKGQISFQKVRLRTTPGAQDAGLLTFDLMFSKLSLTLSVRKWLQGRGLINDVYVSGMKGDVSVGAAERKDAKLIDFFSNPNYELGEVEVCDSVIMCTDQEIGQKFRVSIYNMRMSQLRFRWSLLDLFNADVVSGALNHSLFSIHKRQHKLPLHEMEKDMAPWKRISRLRLNPISVKDLGLDKSNAFNWIEGGSVEMIADLMLPNIYPESAAAEDENKYVVMDLRITFKDLIASMNTVPPALSNGRELISFDELKPIIMFVNNRRGLFSSLRNLDNNKLWRPTVTIERQQSYPDTTVIPMRTFQWPEGEGSVQLNQEIIKYHENPSDNSNEIILRCRIAKHMNELQNTFLFKETDVYDKMALELYTDLMKMIEETEYKKKNDWVKLLGTTFASQLLIFGLGAMV